MPERSSSPGSTSRDGAHGGHPHRPRWTKWPTASAPGTRRVLRRCSSSYRRQRCRRSIDERRPGAEAGRDWWPLAIEVEAAEGAVPSVGGGGPLPPRPAKKVSAVLAICPFWCPVTAAAEFAAPILRGLHSSATAASPSRPWPRVWPVSGTVGGVLTPDVPGPGRVPAQDLEGSPGRCRRGTPRPPASIHWTSWLSAAGWPARADIARPIHGKIEDMVIPDSKWVWPDGRIVHTEGKGTSSRRRDPTDPTLRQRRRHAQRHHPGPPPHRHPCRRPRSAAPSVPPAHAGLRHAG